MTRPGKCVTKPSTTAFASDDQLPSAGFRVRHEEENQNVVTQKFSEEGLRKNRPERTTKQFQSTPSEGETQNVFKQDNSDSKVASKATGRVAEKDESGSLTLREPTHQSGAGVGTLQKGNMKHRLQEVSNSGHHHQSTTGPGKQTLQPDLPAQCTSSELSSSSADGNKDLL